MILLARCSRARARGTFVQVVRALFRVQAYPGSKLHNTTCFATIRGETTRVDASPRKSATFHAYVSCRLERFVRIITECDGSDLELCVPRGDDARKDARGRPRRKDEVERKKEEEEDDEVVFFIAIGKVCRRKVSVYSPRRHELPHRFLLPPRTSSRHQCRFSIST